MVRSPQEPAERGGQDGEWDAVRAQRSRMMRDRVRDRAMRNPEVDALDYWTRGAQGSAARALTAQRPANSATRAAMRPDASPSP